MRRPKPKYKVGDILSWMDTVSFGAPSERHYMLVTGVGRERYVGIDLMSSDCEDWAGISYIDDVAIQVEVY